MSVESGITSSGTTDDGFGYPEKYDYEYDNLPTADLRKIIKEVEALTTTKGWRTDSIDNKHAFAAYIALLHSEASEALEAYRDKKWSETREDGKPLGVGPELADVVIRVLDMCDRWGIDLPYEIARVMKYGWTRPYKHGGREI